MSAYSETYLECARSVLGASFDFAACSLGVALPEYAGLFTATGYARRFAAGEPAVLAGGSGAELAMRVLGRAGLGFRRPAGHEALIGRGSEYWAGWALAYYQWQRCTSFEELFARVPIATVQALYVPYHEMDIQQFVAHMDELCLGARAESRLKAWRQASGLTQRQLASASGVPLRTLQQYEQRQKNINAARSEYVVALARCLGCHPADLLEGTVTHALMQL